MITWSICYTKSGLKLLTKKIKEYQLREIWSTKNFFKEYYTCLRFSAFLSNLIFYFDFFYTKNISHTLLMTIFYEYILQPYEFGKQTLELYLMLLYATRKGIITLQVCWIFLFFIHLLNFQSTIIINPVYQNFSLFLWCSYLINVWQLYHYLKHIIPGHCWVG